MPEYGLFSIPQNTKNKPKQWGPVAEVRASIFRNAEKLGMDPGKLCCFYPFWEQGGHKVFDMITGRSADLLNYIYWEKGHLFGHFVQDVTDAGIRNMPYTNIPVLEATLIMNFRLHQVDGYFLNLGGLCTSGYDDFRLWARNNNNSTMSHYVYTTTAGGVTIPTTTAEAKALNQFITRYSHHNAKAEAILDAGKFYGSSTKTGSLNTTGAELCVINQAGRLGRSAWHLHRSMLMSAEAVNDNAILHLYERPYALLERQAAPVIVDLGANTGYEKGFALI